MMKSKLKSLTNSNYTIPVITIITFTLILGTLLGILHRNSIINQKQSNDLLADRYSKIIELNLEGNINFLNLLAIEFIEGNLPESAFQDKVNNYLKNHPEFINITWVDSNFTIKSVCPLKGNSHIIGLNIELPMPKSASRLAKEQKQTIYTEPFEAIQGESSFEAWNPVFNKNKFMGLFAAVYSSNEVINTWIDINKYSDTYFNLLDGDNELITVLPDSRFGTNIIYKQKSLASLNNGLKLQVRTEISSPFTPLIIAVVLLLSLLILGIAYSFWKLKNTQILLQEKEILLINQNTDLKFAKEKAEESNERFNLAMEATSDGLWDWDLITNEIYYSPGWKSMLGYADNELPNDFSVWEKLTTEEDVKKSWDMLNKHITGELDKFDNELKMQHKEGHWMDISSRATVFYNEHGKAYRVVGTHADITEKKKAKLQLQKSEDRFRKLTENMPSGVAIYRAIDNGNDFEFIDLNKKTEEITNSSKNELIGHTLLEKFPNMENGPFIKSLKKIAKDGVHINLPPFFYKDAQRQGWRENNIYKLASGEIVAIFKDITDIKEAEEQLKKQNLELLTAKEKAEESDRLKSAFLANMSHEIRTPMNGILGFTTLLQNPNLSVENQKNYTNIIEKSGERLLNTVNDIIEISKIESGVIKVTKSEVDIIGHSDTLVTFFRPEAKEKNIDIIVQNNIDGSDLMITTDKNKLSSILSNLIKNAIKFTDKGTIKVGLKVENDLILFSCQDTGIGIQKSRQEAIFNRFEQADIEDKYAHQGSGLGLAIVKTYVEMLDGKIWVESEEGKGSVFYVSLPYEHKKKNEQIIQQKVKFSDSGVKNINVLIAEDDEISSMHLSAILNDKVKKIISAENGIEAIDEVKNDSGIDLILMDMKMPVMDGIEWIFR